MDLRARILAIRDSLSPEQREELSQRIRQNLFSLASFNRASLPLLFYSFRSEVDTIPIIKRLLRQGKKVVLPRTLVKERDLKCYQITSLDQLIQGAFSIWEPNPDICPEIDPALLDVVIVPGSVFDRRGGRFGYGGGFYDRFLERKAPQALRIALAFSCQVMEEPIPVKPHDQFMDYIITDREIIRCHDRKEQ